MESQHQEKKLHYTSGWTKTATIPWENPFWCRRSETSFSVLVYIGDASEQITQFELENHGHNLIEAVDYPGLV